MEMKHAERIQRGRLRLIRAIDRACIARGEAQWTNGYRAGRATTGQDGAEQKRLYEKEIAQFKFCGVAERASDRAIARYARLIRESYNPLRRKTRS